MESENDGELGSYLVLLQLMRQGRFPAVLQRTSISLSNDPDDVIALHYRAKAQYFLHRYESAIETYNQLLKLNENDTAAWLGAGICRADAGRNAEALPFLQRAIATARGDTDARLEMAKALGRLGDHVRERRTLEEAISLQPGDPIAWRLLARSHGAQDHFLEAAAAYMKSLVLNPWDATTWVDRSALFANEGQHKIQSEDTKERQLGVLVFRAALRDVDRALELDPTNPQGIENQRRLDIVVAATFDNLRRLPAPVDGLLGMPESQLTDGAKRCE